VSDIDPLAAAVSDRWRAWRAGVDVDSYERQFQALNAQGRSAHGEADFIASLGRRRVLDAGCGTGRVAIELARRGFDVMGVDVDDEMLEFARSKAPQIEWRRDDLARMQLSRRFDVVAMPGNVMIFVQPDDRRLVVHNLAAHLVPGGLLVAGFSLEPAGLTLEQYDRDCRGCGLELQERYGTWERGPFRGDGADYHVSVHARTERHTVHDELFEARAALHRVTPVELHDRVARGERVTVVDVRAAADQARDGVIVGAVVLAIPRTALEWRCDPASGYSDGAITSLDDELVVVCTDGYSSSLAAAALQRIGFKNATDLVGGMSAWRRAGLPVTAPRQDERHEH
jgi:rhodanese-related sulfurtransferase